MFEGFVDNFQLRFREISTALMQPLSYETHTHVVVQRRHFDETAHVITAVNLAVDGGLRQPAGHGLQRVVGRVVSGGGQDEVDVCGQRARKPVKSVRTVFDTQLVQSVQQHHQRSLGRRRLQRSKKICKPRLNTDIRKYFFLKSSH